MIIARNTITLAHVTDIASVTWYYKLQASTATKPAKPTTDPPTGWTETEPTYTEGSTNSLYVCEKTIYTDGSFTYSEVSLSSSYEAAKLAYNKSVAAQNTAEAAQTTADQAQYDIDHLTIGGRNLILDTGVLKESSTEYSSKYYQSDFGKSLLSDTEADFTVSFDYETFGDYSVLNPKAYIYVQVNGSAVSRPTKTVNITEAGVGHFENTFKLTEAQVAATEAVARVRLRNILPSGYSYKVWNFKIEKGNKATDWTPAPEDIDAQIADASANAVEYIVGTQTASTGSWTGVTKDSALYTGKTIAYKLPYAGSGNASLDLTLADGTTTGAKAVYSNTTRVTTHFGANSVITMTYDGSYWRAAGAAPSNSNTYDRTQYKASLTAAGAIAAGRIAVMNASGQLMLLSTTPFDVTCPILYVGTAYTAAALTQTNNYTMFGSPFSLANTKSGFSGTAGKPVYIKGTMSGKMFTPDSEIFTCTEPTTEDGKSYLLLGIMSTATNAVLNAEHPIYRYVDGAFKSTTQIAAEADQKTTAKYGTCSTAANQAAKVVTLSGFSLYKGARISVAFTNANTAANATLNVNSTGAKTIYAYGAALAANSPYNWAANSTVEFVYNGSQWLMVDSGSLNKLNTLDTSLNQQAIFNRLTNNGQEQGIYLEDGKLYLNFQYAVGQTLKIGGSNNKNGVIKLYNDDDTEWGSWSKDGLTMTYSNDRMELQPHSLIFESTDHYGNSYAATIYGGNYVTGISDSTGELIFGTDFGWYATGDPSMPYTFIISAENIGSDYECGFVLNPYNDIESIKVIGPVLFHDDILFKSGEGALTDVPPQTDILSTAIYLDDNAGKMVGSFSSRFQANGKIGIELEAFRWLANGSKTSALRMLIDSSGNATVYVSDPDAWRKALGIENSVSAVNPSAVNVTSATDTTIGNTGALAAGTYVIECNAEFAAHTTGVRLIYLSASNTGSTIDRTSRMAVPGGSNPARPSFTHLITLTTTTTLYLRAYQNSGTSLSVTGGIRILKIH